MKISIIDYSAKYAKDLLLLLHDVYGSEVTKDTLEDKYISDMRRIIIAIDDESVLGCAFLEERIDHIRPVKTLFVTYVAVRADCRRKGIASMLFNVIMQFAKEKKCSAVELTSANHRADAHSLYKALGFTVKKTTVFIKEIQCS